MFLKSEGLIWLGPRVAITCSVRSEVPQRSDFPLRREQPDLCFLPLSRNLQLRASALGFSIPVPVCLTFCSIVASADAIPSPATDCRRPACAPVPVWLPPGR